MSTADATSRRTVQFLHDLPDGSSHVDWMIARDSAGEAPLISFRLKRRIDELKPGQREFAERIADHRPEYLDYEGPISGDRGSVRLLSRGSVVNESGHSLSSWSLEICWQDRGDGVSIRQRLHLEPLRGGDSTAWEAVCEAVEAIGDAER